MNVAPLSSRQLLLGTLPHNCKKCSANWCQAGVLFQLNEQAVRFQDHFAKAKNRRNPTALFIYEGKTELVVFNGDP